MSKENGENQGLNISKGLKAQIKLITNYGLKTGSDSDVRECPLEARDVVFCIDEMMNEMNIAASEGNNQLGELIKEFQTKKMDIYDFIYNNFVPPENGTFRSNTDSVNNLMNLLKQINN